MTGPDLLTVTVGVNLPSFKVRRHWVLSSGDQVRSGPQVETTHLGKRVDRKPTPNPGLETSLPWVSRPVTPFTGLRTPYPWPSPLLQYTLHPR